MSIKGFMTKEENDKDEGVSREQADKMIRELRWLSWGLVKVPLIVGALVGAFFLVMLIRVEVWEGALKGATEASEHDDEGAARGKKNEPRSGRRIIPSRESP